MDFQCYKYVSSYSTFTFIQDINVLGFCCHFGSLSVFSSLLKAKVISRQIYVQHGSSHMLPSTEIKPATTEFEVEKTLSLGV